MTQDLSEALDNAYRLSVRDRGFNNPLTREIASLIIRFRGVQAKRVLDEIVRAQNAQSRGASADSFGDTSAQGIVPEPPQPDAQLKKPLPQEPKQVSQSQPQAPTRENPLPPSANPVAEADVIIEYEEIKGQNAMSVADKFPRASLVATLLKIKPSEKPEGYTDRQIAAIILNAYKNANKPKRY